MPRPSSRLAILIATICLALMVVALGTAAKHSQFEKPAHFTQYLKQSVKMVAGEQDASAVVPSPAAPVRFASMAITLKISGPAPIRVAPALASPLLI